MTPFRIGNRGGEHGDDGRDVEKPLTIQVKVDV